jgi:hypothetical protein
MMIPPVDPSFPYAPSLGQSWIARCTAAEHAGLAPSHRAIEEMLRRDRVVGLWQAAEGLLNAQHTTCIGIYCDGYDTRLDAFERKRIRAHFGPKVLAEVEAQLKELGAPTMDPQRGGGDASGVRREGDDFTP